jgi:hypothetical protein
MDPVPDKINYKAWAEKLARIADEFVWIYSKGNSEAKLDPVFREALNALVIYKKEVSIPAKIPLKQSIKQAHDLAVSNNLDPWSVILRTIAERADDWTDYVTEENDVTDDISLWLNSEAREEC